MPCHKTTETYHGVVRPHALFTIHQLQQLEYVLLGDVQRIIHTKKGTHDANN